MTTLARKVVGAHAFFFRDNTAFTIPSAGTASRIAKPGATDPKWLDLGEGDFNISPNSKTVDFMAPAPGARVMKDKVTTSRGLKLKGKLFEIQNLSWQLMFGTLDLPSSPTAGGQYNPLEGEHTIKGWLKLQQYGQDNALINVVDLYVAMLLSGDVVMGENPVDLDLEADVLFSIYNTGTLS